jgi:hypothetical protein
MPIPRKRKGKTPAEASGTNSGARVTLLAGVSLGKVACPLRLGVSEA